MRTLLALAILVLTTLTIPALTPAPAHAEPSPKVTEEDAQAQAALVADEDNRLMQVRAVAAVAALSGGVDWNKPYRLDTGSGYTLVLTQQTTPYQVADLLRLAPQTFTRAADGSYLLAENIYLSTGAKLKLGNPGGLTIRMMSNSNGFVSIVSFGGELVLEGSQQAPTTITSWDPRTGKPDTDVDDGRAYVRAIGGQFTMSYSNIQHLGFWSGRTGGLSLTGTQRPDTGQVDGPGHLTKDQRHQKKAERLDGPARSEQPPQAGGVVAQPSGPLETPQGSSYDVPGQSYVSVTITQSVLSGNAFGLFISSAQGITITDTTVDNSLEDGLVMHRGASQAVIERVVAKGNGGDGFVVSRATTQVRVSGSVSERNGRNGFTLSGAPLATGPSASGESVASYGSNSVSNSAVRNNGRYGIEVLGGLDVGIQNNHIDGSDMGIVARQGGRNVAITGNQLRGQKRHGIAVRDMVTDSAVTGNVINGADTAIYVRNSVAEVRGNMIQAARRHGVTLVGAVGGSAVSYNVIAGVGPSALDLGRSSGKVTARENQVFAWHDTSSFWVAFRHYASPMTLLWTGIFLVILFSAVAGARRRRAEVVHPYADKAPLTSAPPLELHLPVQGRARVPELAR
jgi:hypothetical protein